MKKKELEQTPAIRNKQSDNDEDEFVSAVTSMVDIIVRIKDDDTFGNLLTNDISVSFGKQHFSWPSLPYFQPT